MLLNNLDDGKNCGVHIVQDAVTVGRVADKADRPVSLSFPGLFLLVLAYFISHNTIKSAKICRLFHQPNSPDIVLPIAIGHYFSQNCSH